MLVSLATLALGTDASARETMKNLAAIRATLVRTTKGAGGRKTTHGDARPGTNDGATPGCSDLSTGRWFPDLLSCITARPARP